MSTTSFLSSHGMRQPQAGMRRLSTDEEVHQLEILLKLLSQSGTPPLEMRAHFERVMSSVRRAVQRGELDTGFEPDADGTVSMPLLDDPAYLKTAIFWSVALKAPIERVVEACRRTGDGAAEAEVQAALKAIAREDHMCQTDAFFAATDPSDSFPDTDASPLMRM